MHNFFFQPLLATMPGNILAIIFFSSIFYTLVLSYPVKTLPTALALIACGTALSLYANSVRTQDGFTLGLLLGLILATWGSGSIGVQYAIRNPKKPSPPKEE